MIGISTKEILLIAALLFIFVGHQRLNEMARNAGKTKKELDKLKKDLSDINKE